MLKRLSVKLKIYSIAVVSAVGFGIYLAYNFQVNFTNSKILEDVRDTYYPILEKANNNAVMLDRIKELLRAAVQTGETSYIDDAQRIADEMLELFEKTESLEPEKKQTISELSSNFKSYFKLTKSISTEMASGEPDFSTLPARVQEKEALFQKVKTDLNEFIKFAHQRFEYDVESANSNSQRSLLTGFIIWAFSIFLLVTAVITIAKLILSNIKQVASSLHKIALGEDDFSNMIKVESTDEIGQLGNSFNELMINLKEKTNDLDCMMQNMHQGLFTITSNLLIHPEYSSYVENIFNTKEIAGKNYQDILFKDSLLGSDALNQATTAVESLLEADEVMWGFNAHLLPSEYIFSQTINDTETIKIIELDWDPIVADEIIDKIMVTVRDVTELRALQKEAEQQKRELEIVGQILAISVKKFDDFSHNSKELISKNKDLLKDNKLGRDELISKLFINMHTIKGNARTLGLTMIKDYVHDAESTYDQLRKDSNIELNKEQLLEAIDIVEMKIGEYSDIREKKLGGISHTTQSGSIEDTTLPKSLLNRMANSYELLLKENVTSEYRGELASILSELNSIRGIPLAEVLGEIIDSLPGMAKELGKEEPRVIIDEADIFVDFNYSSTIKSIFTHILRNSLDHGIETADERIAAGKAKHGIIEIDTECEKGSITIKVRDDGRGLALGKIKRKAIEKGLTNKNEVSSVGDIANLIFHSGLSTADSVTDISGRGVGMDAVRTYLQEHQCDIAIKFSDNARVDDEYINFEIVLKLDPVVVFQNKEIPTLFDPNGNQEIAQHRMQ